jgi:signal transduction histidine kinase
MDAAALLIRGVARIPAPIHVKLCTAFLAIVALLLLVSVAGLYALAQSSRHGDELVRLQRKVAAFRQVQHDTTYQLYNVTAALVTMADTDLDSALRQLDQFGYDLDRLQYVAGNPRDGLDWRREDHDEFIRVATQAVDLMREGRRSAAREVQASRLRPVADRLERETNELVNRAEAEMVAQVDRARGAYIASLWLVAAFAAAGIVLALVMGYAISGAIVRPLGRVNDILKRIASGDFALRLTVDNRDELASLARRLNRMAEKLGRLYGRLDAASRHKSQFLASMSHELRTPLNAVIGFSEVLRERMYGELNPKQAGYVDDILASGRHLLSLINDILDLSKIEAGRMEIEAGEFDVAALLDIAMTLVRERACSHGISLQREIGPGLGTIRADERKLKQVLLNLLSNAVKFTPDGGLVRVSAKTAPGAVEISVADSGIGIAPEDVPVVFDEFRQVGGDRARKAEGTGLGLALTKKFIELHGGGIRVESAPGVGSTFTVTLPVVPGPGQS